MFRRTNVTAMVAEFLGTAILVTVAIVLTQTTAVSYFIGTSVAVALGLIVMLFGPISGAHVNPAITFGLWTARLISTIRAVGYIAAQLLGGLAAWQLYQYMSGEPLTVRAEAFSATVWLAEVIGAAILAMGITAAITRGFELLHSALTYGAAFFVGLMIAATASAAFINPAIALGSRSWGAAYVLGPLVGGLIGVNLYAWLFSASLPTRRRK